MVSIDDNQNEMAMEAGMVASANDDSEGTFFSRKPKILGATNLFLF